LELAEKKLVLDRHDGRKIGQLSEGPFPERYFSKLSQSDREVCELEMVLNSTAERSEIEMRDRTELELRLLRRRRRQRRTVRTTLSVSCGEGSRTHNPQPTFHIPKVSILKS
jgi:hypothetical protein